MTGSANGLFFPILVHTRGRALVSRGTIHTTRLWRAEYPSYAAVIGECKAAIILSITINRVDLIGLFILARICRCYAAGRAAVKPRPALCAR